MFSLRALSAGLSLFAQSVAADRFLDDRTGVEGFAYGKVPNQTFASSSVDAPLIQVNEWKEQEIDRHGYLLFTMGTADGHGPVIYRADDLSLVYANLTNAHAYDANIQRYEGEDYLTYWEGGKPDVHSGTCWLFDSTYQLRHTIRAQNLSRDADMHECKLTADGTALITVYEVRDYDTSAVGGNASDRIIDGTFQEIDIATGAAVFTWRASDHFGLNDSLVPYAEDRPGKPGYDFAHLNSIEKVDGNYLLSFRHLCTVALVGPDGAPIWTMGGGHHNDFEDLSGGNATSFCYQHDARFAPNSTRELTMYDNHRLVTDVGCTGHCSRGLHVALDPDARTVRVVREYWHPRSVTNMAMGGYQSLPDSDNVLLAWGMTPAITEHAADGTAVMDLQFGPFRDWVAAPSIYRAKKLDWLGRPGWNPSIASVNNGSAKGVYLSWNGATEVAQWAVVRAHALLHPPSKGPG